MAWETCPQEGRNKQSRSTQNHCGGQSAPSGLQCGCMVLRGIAPSLRNMLPSTLQIWQVVREMVLVTDLAMVLVTDLAREMLDKVQRCCMPLKNLCCTDHFDLQGSHRTVSHRPKHSSNTVGQPQQTQPNQRRDRISWLFNTSGCQKKDFTK